MFAVLAAAALLPAQEAPRIDDLGAESPAVREAAAEGFARRGRAAWPALQEAARAHPDPEVRARAAELLRRARLRRRLPYRLLDEHPDALETLEGSGTPAKIRLVRSLTRCFEETSDLLENLTRDPDPEVALAAAETLQENRSYEWIEPILAAYAAEEGLRAGRFLELLTAAASRIPPDTLQATFRRAGPDGRVRLVHLALQAGLPLPVSETMLRAWLRTGPASVRRAALAWLRDRVPLGSFPEIVPLLADPDPNVASEALSTLRSLRGRLDAATLAALLEHDEPAVREEAIQTVLAFEERSLAPALRRRLEDPSAAVRQSALAALGKLEGEAALEWAFDVFRRDAGETREQAMSLLARRPEWTLPRLVAMAADPDPERRRRAYELRARIEGPAALHPLSADPEESVRFWAVGQILRRSDTPGARPALEAFARDPADAVRFEAVRALVRMGRSEHLPSLETFLAGREFTLRHDAAETLLERPGETPLALARRLLADEDPALRRLALNALADRREPGWTDLAADLLAHPDGRLRRAAAHYLGRDLAARPRPETVARLAASLDRAEDETLALIFRIVLEHGDARCAAPLRALLLSGRAPHPERAVRTLAAWAGPEAPAELAGLLLRDVSMQETVLLALREARRTFPGAGTAELAAALEKLRADPDRRRRRAAVALAEELGRSADILPALVGDPEPSVRHAAIAACGRLGLADAADAVAARLDDEDPDVRIAAVGTLLALRPSRRPELEAAAAREECAWARRRMELALRR